MAVAAVGAGDVIVLPQCFAHADGNRFFADIEMGESGHLGAEVELVDLFFEQADFQHLAVEVKPALVVKLAQSCGLRLGFLGLSHQCVTANNWSTGVLE